MKEWIKQSQRGRWSKFILLKTSMVIIGLLALLVLTGCGGSSEIDIVKKGKLNGFEQTTVGKAFDAYFNKPNWRNFETDNGTKIVEFTGKLPRELVEEDFTEVGWTVSTKPKGGDFLMQFMLINDGFEIIYGEVTTILSAPGLEMYGKNNMSVEIPMSDMVIYEWLERIY